MFSPAPLALASSSGFVALDGPSVAARRPAARPSSPAAIEPAAAPVAAADADTGLYSSATWQPAFAARTRRVEAVLVAALCVYFALGLARFAGWL